MSYAAPFSLLSLHVPDHDESVAERLRWPLAGSALLHAVVFIALLGLRFGSSFGQSDGSYEVTLVTLPEIAASPAAPPVTKAKARKAPAAAPQKKAVIPPSKAVPPPVSTDPEPVPKQHVDTLPPPPLEDARDVPKPERVTESLVSALDAVVVPKAQVVPLLPQESAPVRPPVPVEPSPAVEKDVPVFKAPPPPPKLVAGKSAPKPPAPTPAPSVDLLAPKLKQAVSATSVPRKPEPVAKRVSPAVAPQRKQKPDAPRASASPSITVPSRAPRLAAVAPPEVRKKKTPLQTERKSSTVESFQEAIRSVRIPQKNLKGRTVSAKKAGPLVSETVSPAKAAEARNQSLSKVVPPQAPQLAEVQDPVPSESTVSDSASEPETSLEQEIDVFIPDASSAFDPQPVSKYTAGGGKKARGLWQAGLCSPKHPYWKSVEAKIDNIHGNIYRYRYRVESPAILTFRVTRNGQVEDVDVVRSSGNKRFDSVAKDAVLAANPLPPFPTNMTKPFCQVQHEFQVRPN